ncbi:MAG: peptidylprolyl isomerase [Candidatus Izemoplasma sp.]
MQAKLILEKNNSEVVIELHGIDAPGTVENFKKLCNDGFYDGLTFHRVIDGFMAQGGCPLGTGTGGPGYNIDCETKDNTKKHIVGALSMAHAGLNTGGSQFFICYDAFPHLDGKHTVFGQVTSGMELIFDVKQGDKISQIRVT